MTLKDMFSKDRITFNIKSTNKLDVIDELIDILVSNGKINNKDVFRKAVLKREEKFSTGIGMGIAIPHGKSPSVKEVSIVFGRSNKGIDFESIDGKASHLFFLIAVPIESSDEHLRALSSISKKLMHNEIREKLMKVESFEEFIKIFD